MDFHYREVVRNPLGVIRQIYERRGAPLTPLDHFGLTAEEVNEAFGPYLERFDV